MKNLQGFYIKFIFLNIGNYIQLFVGTYCRSSSLPKNRINDLTFMFIKIKNIEGFYVRK